MLQLCLCMVMLITPNQTTTRKPQVPIQKAVTTDTDQPIRQASSGGRGDTSAPAHQKPQAKVVHFPDMVKKAPLTSVETTNQSVYNEALALLAQEEGQFSVQQKKEKDNSTSQTTGRAFPTLFKTSINPKSKYQIQIPASGEFQLLLQPGNEFKVIDNNATDGQAVIQAPTGTIQTALQMHGAKSKNSQLEVHDALYHLKDTLDTRQWDKWMEIGLRPVPVPADWRSEDGTQYILRFKSKEIQSFHMVWQASTQVAPYPPGVNKIGPAGGTVELPGVGKLELPPGALDNEIIVSLHQEREVAENIFRYDDLKADRFSKDGEFASPVIRIEPFLTSLNTPGKLYSTFNWPHPEFLEYLDPRIMRFFSSVDLNGHWQFSYGVYPDRVEDQDYTVPAKITIFKYHAKVMPVSSPENLELLKKLRNQRSSSFSTQNVNFSTCTLDPSVTFDGNFYSCMISSEHFYVLHYENESILAQKYSNNLEKSYNKIISLGFSQFSNQNKSLPVRWFHIDTRYPEDKIPVYLSSRDSAVQYFASDNKLRGTYGVRLVDNVVEHYGQHPPDLEAHEVFHLFQDRFFNYDQWLSTKSNDRLQDGGWIVEGMASFVGAYVGVNHIENNPKKTAFHNFHNLNRMQHGILTALDDRPSPYVGCDGNPAKFGYIKMAGSKLPGVTPDKQFCQQSRGHVIGSFYASIAKEEGLSTLNKILNEYIQNIIKKKQNPVHQALNFDGQLAVRYNDFSYNAADKKFLVDMLKYRKDDIPHVLDGDIPQIPIQGKTIPKAFLQGQHIFDKHWTGNLFVDRLATSYIHSVIPQGANQVAQKVSLKLYKSNHSYIDGLFPTSNAVEGFRVYFVGLDKDRNVITTPKILNTESQTASIPLTNNIAYVLAIVSYGGDEGSWADSRTHINRGVRYNISIYFEPWVVGAKKSDIDPKKMSIIGYRFGEKFVATMPSKRSIFVDCQDSSFNCQTLNAETGEQSFDVPFINDIDTGNIKITHSEGVDTNQFAINTDCLGYQLASENGKCGVKPNE